jgi:branched-chain amino acid transport system ATP-binding protein
MSARDEPVPQGTRNPLLELAGITAGYGSTTVLRDINVAVRPGGIDALLGPNGAGKTTLLRVAAGLLRPTEGVVSVGGVDVTAESPSRRARAGVCLIPEGRGIFRSLSVADNLRLQIPPSRRESDIDKALEAFPVLRDRLRQAAGTLSGGQQQMLALARCYLAKPAIVLLDEVSMGLAPRIVDEIFNALLSLAATGVALLLVEQYVSRALQMADTVHLLNRGSITFAGPSGDLDPATVMRGYLGADLGVPNRTARTVAITGPTFPTQQSQS